MAAHGEIRWTISGDTRWPSTGRFPRPPSTLNAFDQELNLSRSQRALDPMEDDSPRRRRPDLGRILRGFDWPESGSG